MDYISRWLPFPFEHLPFVLLVFAIAFTLHEFAHAYLAYRFGDDTAYRQGRVTLNPLAHFDVLGTILLLIAGFGWAKPVPVMRSKFRYPRLMGVVVSAAGPLSNLLLAFVGVAAETVLLSTAALEQAPRLAQAAVHTFLMYFIGLNGFLFFFNLLPLPPLDGYRIVEDVVPRHVRARLSQYEQWGVFVFLLLVFIPPLNRLVIGRLFDWNTEVIDWFRSLMSVWQG